MPPRSNFILLVGEDAGRHFGCYGDGAAHTPNLDQLAAEGTRYTKCFSTAPVCAPSRCSIVSGMYAWSIGAHHMRSTLVRPPRVFTQDLRQAGYYVNWPTKTDFNFDPPADFADEMRDWLDDLRQERLGDRPFFLFRNFSVTHESSMWSKAPAIHPEGGRERQQNAAITRSLPPVTPREMTVPAYLPDTPLVRADLVRYYQSLAIQDAQIGQVMDALRQSAYAKNTIVIYLSDHGRGLPREKRWCYAAGVNVPLIVWGPGAIAQASVDERLVSGIDIAPTILSLARIPISPHYQGQAFLGDLQSPPRQYALCGRDRMDEAFDRVRAIADPRWHYIRNYFPQLPYMQRNRYMEIMDTTQELRRGRAKGTLSGAAAQWMADAKPREELYDTSSDPEMVRNLAQDAACAITRARLRAALDESLERCGDLGQYPERDLIARGIVVDRLAEFRARIAPLPEEFKIGGGVTVLEMPQ